MRPVTRRFSLTAALAATFLSGCASVAPPRTAAYPGRTYDEVFDATVAGLCGVKKFVVHKADHDLGIVDFLILGMSGPFSGHMKFQAIVSRDGSVPGAREIKQWRKLRAEAVRTGVTTGAGSPGGQPPSVTLIQFPATHPFSIKVHTAIDERLGGAATPSSGPGGTGTAPAAAPRGTESPAPAPTTP